MFPFELVIDGPPVSQQTRRRSRLHEWKDLIRSIAESHWPDAETPYVENVMITIIHFYDTISMDVDNIPKPISDALNGLVYEDDTQITDYLLMKRSINNSLTVRNPSRILEEGLARQEDILYVRVDVAPEQKVIKL